MDILLEDYFSSASQARNAASEDGYIHLLSDPRGVWSKCGDLSQKIRLMEKVGPAWELYFWIKEPVENGS